MNNLDDEIVYTLLTLLVVVRDGDTATGDTATGDTATEVPDLQTGNGYGEVQNVMPTEKEVVEKERTEAAVMPTIMVAGGKVAQLMYQRVQMGLR